MLTNKISNFELEKMIRIDILEFSGRIDFTINHLIWIFYDEEKKK